MSNVINGFEGKYEFLSNAYTCNIEYGGLKYTNVEAAYQAQKCKDKNAMNKFTRLSSAKARAKGRNIEENESFEENKAQIMHDILICKFTQNTDLKKKLLDTKDAKLINNTTFRDTYWGVYLGGTGHNILGKMLELVRAEITVTGN